MANRNAEQRRAEVKYLKTMTLAELSAYCTGVLVANGAILEGQWQAPLVAKRSHRRRAVVRVCECRRLIPPPGPKGGHPRRFCSKDCPVRPENVRRAAA